MPPRFVIVGASLAGATAAATLRQEGFDGDIVLIGDEPDAPYERPPLSKQYLRGETAFERMLVRPRSFYDEHRIELVLGERAVRLDSAGRTVRLATGRTVAFDKLLIATGVRNRRPPVPGIDLDGVFDLRGRADADAIRREIAPGRRAVLVGMGFIGCEVAASLRGCGVEVVAIDPAPCCLFRALGLDVGRSIASIHRAHGVEMLFEEQVVRIDGAPRAARVVTASGRQIDCDFVVVGTGVQPATEVAAGTDVAVGDGILVDELCQTSVPGIFAAGDVARHHHPLAGRPVRVEHWQNAIRQGAAAARSMLGRGRPYDELHWFWSDQYDCNLQYAGFHEAWDRLAVRGRLDGPHFLAFYLRDGRVVAAAALNRGKELRRALPLVRARQMVDPDRLADESVELRELAAPRA